jgi:hypothetical protein
VLRFRIQLSRIFWLRSGPSTQPRRRAK